MGNWLQLSESMYSLMTRLSQNLSHVPMLEVLKVFIVHMYICLAMETVLSVLTSGIWTKLGIKSPEDWQWKSPHDMIAIRLKREKENNKSKLEMGNWRIIVAKSRPGNPWIINNGNIHHICHQSDFAVPQHFTLHLLLGNQQRRPSSYTSSWQLLLISSDGLA